MIPLMVISAAGLLVAEPVEASPTVGSWNLSRDLLTGGNVNPVGPWSFVYSEPTVANSPIVAPFMPPTLLQPVSQTCLGGWITCWQHAFSSALVGYSTLTGTNISLNWVRGVPLLHPGSDRRVAVRWTNPTGQAVDLKILGRVTDLDPGGDPFAWDGGVAYAVINVSANTTLATNTVQSTPTSPRDGSTFYATTTVGINQEIYFIIDRRGGYGWDTTELDVLITATIHCSIPCD